MRNITAQLEDVRNYFIEKIIDRDFQLVEFDIDGNYYDLNILIDCKYTFRISLSRTYNSIIEQLGSEITLNISKSEQMYEILNNFCTSQLLENA